MTLFDSGWKFVITTISCQAISQASPKTDQAQPSSPTDPLIIFISFHYQTTTSSSRLILLTTLPPYHLAFFSLVALHSSQASSPKYRLHVQIIALQHFPSYPIIHHLLSASGLPATNRPNLRVVLRRPSDITAHR